MGSRARARPKPDKAPAVGRHIAAQATDEGLDAGIDLAENHYLMIAVVANRIAERRRDARAHELRPWLAAVAEMPPDSQITKRLEFPGRIRSGFVGDPHE